MAGETAQQADFIGALAGAESQTTAAILQVQTPKLGVETWGSWREYFAHLQRHGTAVEGPDWDTFSARMFAQVQAVPVGARP